MKAREKLIAKKFTSYPMGDFLERLNFSSSIQSPISPKMVTFSHHILKQISQNKTKQIRHNRSKFVFKINFNSDDINQTCVQEL